MFILYNADVHIAMINLEPADLADLQAGRVLSWTQGEVRCGLVCNRTIDQIQAQIDVPMTVVRHDAPRPPETLPDTEG